MIIILQKYVQITLISVASLNYLQLKLFKVASKYELNEENNKL